MYHVKSCLTTRYLAGTLHILRVLVNGNFQPMPLTLLVVPFLDNTLVQPHLTRQPQEKSRWSAWGQSQSTITESPCSIRIVDQGVILASYGWWVITSNCICWHGSHNLVDRTLSRDFALTVDVYYRKLPYIYFIQLNSSCSKHQRAESDGLKIPPQKQEEYMMQVSRLEILGSIPLSLLPQAHVAGGNLI